jgi:hypothetical protein
MDSKSMTLQQAIVHFSDPDNCVAYMVEQRWPDGVVVCPTCGRNDVSWLANQRKWQCKSKHTKRQFSAKVGTIFEDSPLGLDKWILATWMLTNCKNGVSSYEIARSIGVTQKSAWFMMHRIRLAMKDEAPALLGGPEGGAVEVDESFVGSNPKNWSMAKREKHRKEVRPARVRTYQNRFTHKTSVVGMLDRDSRQVRAKVVPNVKRETLQKEIMDTIEFGSKVYTDSAVAYTSLKEKYVHETVNHAVQYVNGQVHTNSLENFWSLMKRNLAGTYVAVEPFHLDRYLDEQVFRFNNRLGMRDADRFAKVLSQAAGKRLTYAEVTGKVGQTAF